jgi:hypothetical protein
MLVKIAIGIDLYLPLFGLAIILKKCNHYTQMSDAKIL